MPVNIIRRLRARRFTGGLTTPAIRDWRLTPASYETTSSVPGLFFNATAAQIEVVVKDYFATAFAATHSDFLLNTSIIQDVNAPGLLAISSTSHVINNAIAINAAFNATILITVDFINENTLLEGSYTGYLELKVSAINNVTLLREDIDSRSVAIRLLRVGSTLNVLTPQTINLAHVRGSSTNTAVAALDILPAVLNGSSLFVLQHSNFLTAVVPNAIYSQGPLNAYNIYSGSGVTNASVGLNASAWAQRAVGVYTEVVSVYFPDWLTTLGTQVRVTVFDAGTIVVYPDSLVYSSISGAEFPVKTIDVVSDSPITVTSPSWLTVTGDLSGGVSQLTAVVLPVANFSRGEYFGAVVFSNGSYSVTIPVRLSVIDALETTVSNTRANFSRDNLNFRIQGYDSNHYMQVTSVVHYLDAVGNAAMATDVVKAPFVNDVSNYALSGFIHAVMQRLGNNLDAFTRLSDIQHLQDFDTAQSVRVDFKIAVYDRRNAAAPVFVRDLLGCTFIQGTTPQEFNESLGFASYHNTTSRITPQGVHVFNMIGTNVCALTVLKNNDVIATQSFNGQVNIGQSIAVRGSELVIGDVVTCRMNYIDPAGLDASMERSVIVYPADKYTHTLAFVTDYNTVELLECTGALQSESEYDRRSNVVFKNGIELLQHIDTLRDDVVVLGTGVVPHAQRAVIDAIKRSREIVLLDASIGAIPLSITSTSLEHSDNERFLEIYSLELRINRAVDAQVYHF